MSCACSTPKTQTTNPCLCDDSKFKTQQELPSCACPKKCQCGDKCQCDSCSENENNCICQSTKCVCQETCNCDHCETIKCACPKNNNSKGCAC